MALATDTRTVLIVEDDHGIAEFLGWALRDQGLEVRHALTLSEAIRLYEELGPDLVITDLVLPDGFGVEVVRRAKTQNGHMAVPSVVLSAHPRAPEYAQEAGADACLSKPFDLGTFFDTVESLLGRSGPYS